MAHSCACTAHKDATTAKPRSRTTPLLKRRTDARRRHEALNQPCMDSLPLSTALGITSSLASIQDESATPEILQFEHANPENNQSRWIGIFARSDLRREVPRLMGKNGGSDLDLLDGILCSEQRKGGANLLRREQEHNSDCAGQPHCADSVWVGSRLRFIVDNGGPGRTVYRVAPCCDYE